MIIIPEIMGRVTTYDVADFSVVELRELKHDSLLRGELTPQCQGAPRIEVDP